MKKNTKKNIIIVIISIAIAVMAVMVVAAHSEVEDFHVADCADCNEGGTEDPESLQCLACFAQPGRASRKRRFLGKKRVVSQGREVLYLSQRDADDFGEAGPKDFRDPEEDKPTPVTVTMADGERMTLVPRATFKRELKVHTVYDIVEAD